MENLIQSFVVSKSNHILSELCAIAPQNLIEIGSQFVSNAADNKKSELILIRRASRDRHKDGRTDRQNYRP